MLEVDVEANNILLTEPLTLEVANDNSDTSSYHGRDSSRSKGYENSYVMKHFIAGTMALVVLAAMVYFNRQSLSQCGSDEVFGNGPNANGTITEIIVRCNITGI